MTALLKTVSAENVTVLLQVHKAVYNQNSSIILLSEYQVREDGIVVDAVASKHLTTNERKRIQTFYASEHVKCPLTDRRGLMRIKLYPMMKSNMRYSLLHLKFYEDPGHTRKEEHTWLGKRHLSHTKCPH